MLQYFIWSASVYGSTVNAQAETIGSWVAIPNVYLRVIPLKSHITQWILVMLRPIVINVLRMQVWNDSF